MKTTLLTGASSSKFGRRTSMMPVRFITLKEGKKTWVNNITVSIDGRITSRYRVFEWMYIFATKGTNNREFEYPVFYTRRYLF